MSTVMSNVDRVNFMNERVRLIDANKTIEDMPLDGNPRVVLHMFPERPLEGTDIAAALGLSGAAGVSSDLANPGMLQPITPGSFTRIRFDEDGVIIYTGYDYDMVKERGGFDFADRTPTANSYLRIFNSGIVEAVKASYYKGDKLLLHRRYERDLLQAIPRFLKIQQELGVELPIFVRLTLTGAMKCYIGDDDSKAVGGKITSPQLRPPEVTLDTFTPGERPQLAEIMRRPFYEIWRAAGLTRSMNYNENDEWAGF
jgi:hypothetical protein